MSEKRIMAREADPVYCRDYRSGEIVSIRESKMPALIITIPNSQNFADAIISPGRMDGFTKTNRGRNLSSQRRTTAKTGRNRKSSPLLTKPKEF